MGAFEYTAFATPDDDRCAVNAATNLGGRTQANRCRDRRALLAEYWLDERSANEAFVPPS